MPVYWVSFTDKNNTPFSIDSPEAFLTSRSLERRARQNIEVDEKDLPVNPEYINGILAFGVELINVSKWFNGIMVGVHNPSALDSIARLAYVKSPPKLIKPGNVEQEKREAVEKSAKLTVLPIDETSYGPSLNQVSMLKGELLHQNGFSGEGILIGVLDAGFTNANTISSLSHLWQRNKVIAMRDFVRDGKDLFNSHEHGTVVLSIMAGKEHGILFGSAPEAGYILVRTEDGAMEYIIEEYNWICGAEFADSLGVDVINTSLGYTQFNDSTQDHSYEDMDGKTTPISIAANIAAKKGILVVTSAGNSGAGNWLHIGAPADADQIIAVGATDSLGIITNFSSRGPSYDGRVKPDISAMGFETIAQRSNGEFGFCTGTSCASPVIAGMIACLWQANPGATNLQIIEQVKKSSSNYFEPDSLYGYGIPHFVKSSVMLGNELKHDDQLVGIMVYPNPVVENMYLLISDPQLLSQEKILIEIYNIAGQLLVSSTYRIGDNSFVIGIDEVSTLEQGLFLLNVYIGSELKTTKFIKL